MECVNYNGSHNQNFQRYIAQTCMDSLIHIHTYIHTYIHTIYIYSVQPAAYWSNPFPALFNITHPIPFVSCADRTPTPLSFFEKTFTFSINLFLIFSFLSNQTHTYTFTFPSISSLFPLYFTSTKQTHLPLSSHSFVFFPFLLPSFDFFLPFL